MKAKPQLKQSMQEEQIRTALNTHWHASAVGDANAEHDIYDDDAICDYPVVRQYPICLKTIDFSPRALQYSYPCQCS